MRGSACKILEGEPAVTIAVGFLKPIHFLALGHLWTILHIPRHHLQDKLSCESRQGMQLNFLCNIPSALV